MEMTRPNYRLENLRLTKEFPRSRNIVINERFFNQEFPLEDGDIDRNFADFVHQLGLVRGDEIAIFKCYWGRHDISSTIMREASETQAEPIAILVNIQIMTNTDHDADLVTIGTFNIQFQFQVHL